MYENVWLQYAVANLKKDREVVLAAVSLNGDAFSCVDKAGAPPGKNPFTSAQFKSDASMPCVIDGSRMEVGRR